MHAITMVLTPLWCLVAGQLSPAELPTDGGEDVRQQQIESLKQMREQAQATRVFVLDRETERPATLVPEPIMRYSVPQLDVADATLWCFTEGQRPVAFLKVESREVRWVSGATSLCGESIEVQWNEEHVFRTAEPGLTFEEVPHAPPAAATDIRRLFQMKQIARRFSATFHSRRDGPEEMRVLPQPVYLYADDEAGVTDGVAFAFTSQTTNPNAILLLEIRESEGIAEWHYAIARLTSAGLSVRLDDLSVWEVPRLGPESRVAAGQPVITGTYATAHLLKDD